MGIWRSLFSVHKLFILRINWFGSQPLFVQPRWWEEQFYIPNMAVAQAHSRQAPARDSDKLIAARE